ncbi:NAD-dependent epimerase/dehydratase family protein [Streptomyces sp. NPDC001820]|uniref:NAD-dependent epimerase/dehydratase family protein n=1 Tax=Streptomyces sp. NPDC001820 TaxID=3364613 RepID=UPI0036D000E5
MSAEDGRSGRQRVAVLGGTGWIGRHICAAASARGHDIVVVARHPAPHVSAHTFVPLDLAHATTEEITALLRAERIGVVVNSTDAANATDGWTKSEQDMALVNVGLVGRLLAGMSALPWRSRIVHIGTMHEYGEVAAGTAMDETITPRPGTAYTRTKLAGSQAVLDAVGSGLVDGLVLRAANVSGPHPSPASFPGKLVGMLRQALASGQRMPVVITQARRDFVDVRDVAEAVVKAVETSVSGRVLNIGSGVAVDMRTLVRLFVTAAGHSVDMIDEEIRHVPSLGGAWTRADIRLAGQLLGWQPRIGLEESLGTMWSTATAGDRLEA